MEKIWELNTHTTATLQHPASTKRYLYLLIYLLSLRVSHGDEFWHDDNEEHR